LLVSAVYLTHVARVSAGGVLAFKRGRDEPADVTTNKTGNNMKNPIKKALIITSSAALALMMGCSGGGEVEGEETLSITGSDTLLQVGLAWAEAYRDVDPNVIVSVNGGGSGTGIKALINGTVQIANSSRKIKDSELTAIKENTGKDPVEHIVGFDGIAVYTHKENPQKSISIETLHGIFAEGGEITTWEGVEGSSLTGDINRVSRSNTSGTYAFFKEAVCGKGVEFKKGASIMAGSTAVVELISSTKNAIGYSGMGYKNDHVNWLSVYTDDVSDAAEPTIENVKSGKYPIARPLYLYTVGEPEGAVKAYIDWIKGHAGQDILIKEKFVPIPDEQMTK
jgi:phosphate transport system substrate-binding protein